jgi:aspartate/methionine/tyrosine aminotransferase
VLLVPGSTFGVGANHFRVGLGRTDVPVALERLEAFAERTLH